MSTSRSRGFTLIELMIVVAVIAVLAIIALPSYLQYVRKSHRSDAITTMNTIALQEERWRSNNPSYGTLADLGYTGTQPSTTYYTFALTPAPTASLYTVVATAIGNQARDSQFGIGCSTLTITSTGTKMPAKCFGQ